MSLSSCPRPRRPVLKLSLDCPFPPASRGCVVCAKGRCCRGGAAPPPTGTDGAPSPPGLLWQLRPSDVEVELLAHTRRVVSRDLEEETGLHTGWIQNGGLFIASNRQRLDEYKRLMSVGAPCRMGGSLVGGCALQGGSPDRSGLKPWCCP